MVGRVPHRHSLRARAFRAGNDVFTLALNPEVRRIIGQIGDQRDEWPAFLAVFFKALSQFPVEVRNHRQHHVGWMFRPVLPQRLDDRPVIEMDRSLQNAEKLRSKARPAAAQDLVVDILDSYTRRAANQVERIEQFLDIEELDLPGMILRGLMARSGCCVPLRLRCGVRRRHDEKQSLACASASCHEPAELSNFSQLATPWYSPSSMASISSPKSNNSESARFSSVESFSVASARPWYS